MDLILYCIIIAVVGFARVGKTSQISDEVGIVDTGVTVSIPEYDNIPVGNNLALMKESRAFTLILEELGLA